MVVRQEGNESRQILTHSEPKKGAKKRKTRKMEKVKETKGNNIIVFGNTECANPHSEIL